MGQDDILFAWERFPEYIAVRQYGRCLGRILASLPTPVRGRATTSMTHAAIWISRGIAMAHAELPPGEWLPHEERVAFRDAALSGIEFSREGLSILKEERLGSRPDISAAFELLERVESGVRSREVPSD